MIGWCACTIIADRKWGALTFFEMENNVYFSSIATFEIYLLKQIFMRVWMANVKGKYLHCICKTRTNVD